MSINWCYKTCEGIQSRVDCFWYGLFPGVSKLEDDIKIVIYIFFFVIYIFFWISIITFSCYLLVKNKKN